MILAEDADSLFQIRTIAKNTTLIRNRCAYLAGSRAAMEVPIDFPCVELRYFSFRSYLSPQSLPVKAQCGSGVLCQFFALSAFLIREKAKAAFPYPLRQYHAHAGYAVPRRGRQSSRVGIVRLALLSLREPGIEQFKRIFRSDFMRIVHIRILAACLGC